MKLLGIYIYDYLQFKDFEIDFTYPKSHPKAGKPLEKVCFIGRNGTGKSNLLNIIQSNIHEFYASKGGASIIYKIEVDDRKFYLIKRNSILSYLFYEEIDTIVWIGKVLFLIILKTMYRSLLPKIMPVPLL